MSKTASSKSAPDPAGWSLNLALGVLAGLMTVVALVIAIAIRLFDRFDLVTELLIGAVFFLVVFGVNAAMIFYLHSMAAGDRHKSETSAAPGVDHNTKESARA